MLSIQENKISEVVSNTIKWQLFLFFIERYTTPCIFILVCVQLPESLHFNLHLEHLLMSNSLHCTRERVFTRRGSHAIGHQACGLAERGSNAYLKFDQLWLREWIHTLLIWELCSRSSL